MARKKHYINNKDFYEALKVYLAKCEEAEKEGKPLPIIPDYIGKAFMLISERMGKRPNFADYSYLDEMKLDAIENCIKQIRSFNPKYENPFAYFSQIIKNAFIRRIKFEKTQHACKIKTLINMNITDEIAGITSQGPVLNEITNEYIRAFDASREKKIKKPKKAKMKNEFISVVKVIEEN